MENPRRRCPTGRRTLAAWALAVAGSVGSATADVHPAQAVVQAATEAILGVWSASESDTQGARWCEAWRSRVDPHFDFVHMTKRVLGAQWARATGAQRARAVDALRRFLMSSYLSVLSEGKQTRVDYLATEVGPRHATVRTRVSQRFALRVPISYAMHAPTSEWKVYDVTASGVSLVALYRATLAEEIRKRGLAALLDRLQAASDREHRWAIDCAADRPLLAPAQTIAAVGNDAVEPSFR